MRFNYQIVEKFFLGGLAVVCFVLLFVGGPGPYSTRTFSYAWGLGHLFSFALWTSLYLRWRVGRSIMRRVVEALTLAFLIGGCSEMIQLGIEGREATFPDFGLDLLGSLLILVFLTDLKTRLQAYQLWLLRLPVLLIVGWVMQPLLAIGTDDLAAYSQFPLLAGFETTLELGRWGGNSEHVLDNKIVFNGTGSLRVTLNTHRYSGVSLRHFPADWSEYRAIQMQIHNPAAEPLDLFFRIHDQLHRQHENRYSDRFNTQVTLVSGWTKLEIPLELVRQAPKTRTMDLSRIGGMILFVGKLESPRMFYLDEIKLIR